MPTSYVGQVRYVRFVERAQYMAKEGRPPKFKTVEELDNLIESYFADCKERGEPPFFVELCVWLDTTRKTLLEYEEKDEFRNSVKRAKARCEAAIEKGMLTNKFNATGSIFNLKNNYGWEDRQKVDNTHSLDDETSALISRALDDV